MLSVTGTAAVATGENLAFADQALNHHLARDFDDAGIGGISLLDHEQILRDDVDGPTPAAD